MNKRFKWIVLLIISLSSKLAWAELRDLCFWGWYDALSPSIGLDYTITHIKRNADWTNEFSKAYRKANPYVQFKFHEYFGLELGYEQSSHTTKESIHAPEDTFFGNTLETFSYRRRAQFKTYHMDLNYLLCIGNCFEFLASFGLGDLRMESRALVSRVPTGTLSSALMNAEIARRAIARVRAGILFYITPHIGMRGLLGMDGTAHLKLKDPRQIFYRNGIPLKPFKDSFSASIGVFLSY